MRVSLAKFDRTFSVQPKQSVLDAALNAGFNLARGCKGGNCGACRVRLLSGHVTYPNGAPLGLSEAQKNEGFILLCQAHARSDLSIESFEVNTPDEARIKRLPSRIERTDALSHDVLALYLRLPAVAGFKFQPGQYIDIVLPGGRRRSFSIASPPHDSQLLELHVRRVPGGEFTELLFDRDVCGMLLSIEGPLGQFVYRSGGSAPMLLVGGGTGLAPLKSILRHVIETGLAREIHLYWGVRSRRDLYADADLQRLARQVSTLRYVTVLSEPNDDWRGPRGWVHEAVLRDFERLDATDIYASGPPAMISAVRRAFELRGADPARLLFDSFDYAPDSVARHRTMAASKS